MDYVDVPGAVLYTEHTGNGLPLLLISGCGGDAGMYEQVVPLLARQFTDLVYDRRETRAADSPIRTRRPSSDSGRLRDLA